jgi:hypothetical protein
VNSSMYISESFTGIYNGAYSKALGTHFLIEFRHSSGVFLCCIIFRSPGITISHYLLVFCFSFQTNQFLNLICDLETTRELSNLIRSQNVRSECK